MRQKKRHLGHGYKVQNLLAAQAIKSRLDGDPDRIRTCNLPLRRGLLYPVEPRDLRIDLDLISGFVI